MSTHRQLPNNTDIAPWQKKGRWYHIFFESTSEGYTISQENSDADILEILRSLSGSFPIVMSNENFRICDYKVVSKHTDFVITADASDYKISLGYPISDAESLSISVSKLTNQIVAETSSALIIRYIPAPFYLQKSQYGRFYYQTPIFIESNQLVYYNLSIYSYSSLTKYVGTIADGALTWSNEEITSDYEVQILRVDVPQAKNISYFDYCDLYLFGYFE